MQAFWASSEKKESYCSSTPQAAAAAKYRLPTCSSWFDPRHISQIELELIPILFAGMFSSLFVLLSLSSFFFFLLSLLCLASARVPASPFSWSQWSNRFLAEKDGERERGERERRSLLGERERSLEQGEEGGGGGRASTREVRIDIHGLVFFLLSSFFFFFFLESFSRTFSNLRDWNKVKRRSLSLSPFHILHL